MKTDREDVPEYLRRKKRGSWRMYGYVGLGSVITWALIALVAKPFVVDVALLKQAVRFADEPVQQAKAPLSNVAEARRAEAAQASVALQRESQRAANNYIVRHDAPEAQDLAEQLSGAAPRQTSFSDSNYSPRTDVNTIQSSKPVQYVANNSTHNSQQASRRSNSASWTWVGADRKSQPIDIHWMTSDGWIEFDTVCQNHRRGSIEYRDCRKAAKEYFRHRCRTENRRAFCLAENRYYP